MTDAEWFLTNHPKFNETGATYVLDANKLFARIQRKKGTVPSALRDYSYAAIAGAMMDGSWPNCTRVYSYA